MEMKGKVIVVTGGASGIGAALARRFAQEGAAGIVVADLDEGAGAGGGRRGRRPGGAHRRVGGSRRCRR